MYDGSGGDVNMGDNGRRGRGFDDNRYMGPNKAKSVENFRGGYSNTGGNPTRSYHHVPNSRPDFKEEIAKLETDENGKERLIYEGFREKPDYEASLFVAG